MRPQNLFIPMKYYLFLDECGHIGITNPDLDFPVFVLCGVLSTDNDYEIIRQEINKIKEEIWGDKKVVFHSRKIRKCEKEFSILFNSEIKGKFYELINNVVSNLPYTIVASAIQKDLFIEQLDRPEYDVYEIALSFVIEQAVTLLQNSHAPNELAIIIEQRGYKEDKQLKSHFQRLCSVGNSRLSPVDLNNVNPSITFRNKKENINGLQLADLVAYPIARYLINPQKANLSFHVLKNKIYKAGNNHVGLLVFP